MPKLLLSLFMLLTVTAFSQKTATKIPANLANRSAVKPAYSEHTPQLDHELRDQKVVKKKPTQSTAKATYNEMIIGNTQYDLQSNYSVQNRFIKAGDDLAAIWTMSWQVSPFGDRGTGYNSSADDGLVWSDIPTERVETIRTGWPNMLITGDGRQVVLCHEYPVQLFMAYKDPGDVEWTESYIDTDVPEGVSWSRAASGGTDGNTIHLIYSTVPTANQTDVPTVTYQGLDGALLYSRSTDQGDTWDIHEVILEGMDSTNYLGCQVDGYAIHARGDKVAFAVFNSFSDSFVMISEDNGDTWTKKTLVDFPVDLYTGDDEIIDLDEDMLADTVYNSDNTGAVFVDQSSKVHVTYGNMRYLDDVLGDDQWSYFPFTDGLAYWNEDMDEDTRVDIAFSEDVDESGVLELSDDIGTYFMSMTSMSQIAQDSNGDLFVSYSGVIESHTTGTQNFRHLYFMKSEDGGDNWSTPVDGTPDEEFIGYEAIHGTMVPDVDDKLHVMYQRDQEPGWHVRGDLDPVDLNDIVYLWVTTDLNFEVGVAELPVQFEIYPNPAKDQIRVDIDAEINFYSITDLSGRVIQTGNVLLEGGTISLDRMSAGMYVLSLATSKGIVSQQFVKE
jgi:ribosomal protein L24E